MYMQNPNVTHKQHLSKLDRLALVITERVGTMGFFFIILGWTVIWLGWNIFAPAQFHFDPFPAFVLWLFISNLIQINLMPLIMIGQNIQGKHAEIRTDHDYQVDRQAFVELGEIKKLVQETKAELNKLQKDVAALKK
jgi:uncharacterized membrane protein